MWNVTEVRYVQHDTNYDSTKYRKDILYILNQLTYVTNMKWSAVTQILE